MVFHLHNFYAYFGVLLVIGDLKRPVYNLEGSIFKWANENRPIVNGDDKPTHLVHPYNSFFGKLLESSRRASML